MKRLMGLVLIAVILCACAGAGAIATPKTIPVLSREDIPDTPHGVHNYLLLCVDSWNGNPNNLGNTDGMILVTADEVMGRITLTSFIRDLLVKNPEKSGYNRLSRYVINNGGNQEAVEKLVGIYETHFGLHIDHYIVVDWTMIQNIIDAAGGVDITITDGEATRLRSKTAYNSSWTDPVLPAKNGGGTYHFKGHAAVIYMRIRSSYVVNGEANDFRRTSRARQVLSSLAGQLSDISYDRALELLDVVVENTLVTNMSAADLFNALQIAYDLRGAAIEEMRIPIQGTFEEIDYGGSAQQIDYPKNREALHSFLFGTFVVREEDPPEEDTAALMPYDPVSDEELAWKGELYEVPQEESAYAAFMSAFNAFFLRSVETDYPESEEPSAAFQELLRRYQEFLDEYQAFEEEYAASKAPLLLLSKKNQMEERRELVGQAMDRLDQMTLSGPDEIFYQETLERMLMEMAPAEENN